MNGIRFRVTISSSPSIKINSKNIFSTSQIKVFPIFFVSFFKENSKFVKYNVRVGQRGRLVVHVKIIPLILLCCPPFSVVKSFHLLLLPWPNMIKRCSIFLVSYMPSPLILLRFQPNAWSFPPTFPRKTWTFPTKSTLALP